MAKVNPGDKLKDNDKRQKGRIITIVSVDDTMAYYHTGKRAAKLRLDRIFTDGKRRQRGYNLVKS